MSQCRYHRGARVCGNPIVVPETYVRWNDTVPVPERARLEMAEKQYCFECWRKWRARLNASHISGWVSKTDREAFKITASLEETKDARLRAYDVAYEGLLAREIEDSYDPVCEAKLVSMVDAWYHAPATKPFEYDGLRFWFNRWRTAPNSIGEAWGPNSRLKVNVMIDSTEDEICEMTVGGFRIVPDDMSVHKLLVLMSRWSLRNWKQLRVYEQLWVDRNGFPIVRSVVTDGYRD